MTRTNCRTVKDKEEKKNTDVVCCMDCLHSNLHRYGCNPILAQCTVKPNTGNARFPYQVMVAATKWVCPMYKHTDGEKFIQVRVKPSAGAQAA